MLVVIYSNIISKEFVIPGSKLTSTARDPSVSRDLKISYLHAVQPLRCDVVDHLLALISRFNKVVNLLPEACNLFPKVI